MNWKRLLFTCICALLGVYLVLAMTMFNRPTEADTTCGDVHITIEKGIAGGFLKPDDVRRMLVEKNIYPVGQLMKSINLRSIEEQLETDELIANAECYKTQSGNVNIDISERVPVVRIMARNGDDYYVDNNGGIIRNTDYPCNLVVATGYIGRDFARNKLAPIGSMLMGDDFWRNQIVQMNVLQDSTIEMVPRVGEHLIYIGAPENIEHKLQRLRKFYRYGLSEAGWNKYSRISVEFDNQIVCKKR